MGNHNKFTTSACFSLKYLMNVQEYPSFNFDDI